MFAAPSSLPYPVALCLGWEGVPLELGQVQL